MEDGVYELANRLAEYEDTGLTPEQIRKLKERSTEKKPIEHITKFAPMYECPFDQKPLSFHSQIKNT